MCASSNVTAGCPTLVHSRHSPRNTREPVSLHELYTAEPCSLLPNYAIIVCQRCDERESGIRQADRYSGCITRCNVVEKLGKDRLSLFAKNGTIFPLSFADKCHFIIINIIR